MLVMMCDFIVVIIMIAVIIMIVIMTILIQILQLQRNSRASRGPQYRGPALQEVSRNRSLKSSPDSVLDPKLRNPNPTPKP